MCARYAYMATHVEYFDSFLSRCNLAPPVDWDEKAIRPVGVVRSDWGIYIPYRGRAGNFHSLWERGCEVFLVAVRIFSFDK